MMPAGKGIGPAEPNPTPGNGLRVLAGLGDRFRYGRAHPPGGIFRSPLRPRSGFSARTRGTPGPVDHTKLDIRPSRVESMEKEGRRGRLGRNEVACLRHHGSRLWKGVDDGGEPFMLSCRPPQATRTLKSPERPPDGAPPPTRRQAEEAYPEETQRGHGGGTSIRRRPRTSRAPRPW